MYRGNDGTTNENNRSTTARIGNRPDRTCKARTPDKNRGYVYTMNVADLSLCKELYEVSGWTKPQDEPHWHLDSSPHLCNVGADDYDEPERYVPAYDLGYLLRKLPAYHGQNMLTLKWIQQSLKWLAGYEDRDGFVEEGIHAYAFDPEDAACKLCISLIKSGILLVNEEKIEKLGTD